MGQGTLVRDQIEYEMHLGVVGEMANAFFTSRQIRNTFAYRQTRTPNSSPAWPQQSKPPPQNPPPSKTIPKCPLSESFVSKRTPSVSATKFDSILNRLSSLFLYLRVWYVRSAGRKGTDAAGALSASQLGRQHSTFAARSFGGSAVEQAQVLQRSGDDQAAHRISSRHFSKIPISPPDRANQSQVRSSLDTPPRVIQRKLVVGQLNNPLESEADSVAEHVMRTPDPAAISPQAPTWSCNVSAQLAKKR